MKLLTVILLIILMMGVTPVFAANSHPDEQSITTSTLKGSDSDIENVYKETEQFDDDIGDYIVVDSSDMSDVSCEDVDYRDESNNEIYSASGSMYALYQHNAVGEGYDELDSDYIIIDESDISNEEGEEFGDNDYIVIDSSDENANYTDELTDDQMDEDGDYIIIEEETEFEYAFEFWYIEEIDDTAGLNEDDIVIDSSDDQLGDFETISCIDMPVTTCESLLVTLVDELCGVVQMLL